MPKKDDRRFIVDVMLIKLGRWLRILGYDCKIPKNKGISDDRLMAIAEKENRILLTMDKELSGRKTKTSVIYIPSKLNSIKSQLEYLIKNNYIENNLSDGKIEDIIEESVRCSKCGSELIEISKNDLLEKINEKRREIKIKNIDKVLSTYDYFWICKKCKQVYWKGSHWKKIIEFLSSLK